jgi:hypothetical protein
MIEPTIIALVENGSYHGTADFGPDSGIGIRGALQVVRESDKS